MAQPNPIAMFNYGLNLVRGVEPGKPWSLTKTLPIDVSVANAALQSGMVAYMDSANKAWKLGVLQPTLTTGSVATGALPFFLFQNGTDYDVTGTKGNIVGLVDGYNTTAGSGIEGQVDPDASALISGSQVTGFAANCAAEMETVSFDLTQAASAFAPGVFLSSATAGATAGQLAPLVMPAAGTGWAACGIVSDGVKATDMTQANNAAGPVPTGASVLTSAIARSNPLALRFHSIFQIGR